MEWFAHHQISKEGIRRWCDGGVNGFILNPQFPEFLQTQNHIYTIPTLCLWFAEVRRHGSHPSPNQAECMSPPHVPAAPGRSGSGWEVG